MKKLKRLYGENYDYSLVVFDSYKTTITIKCELHGEFNKCVRKIKKGIPCIKCKYWDEFLKKAKVKHNDMYDYSETVYDDYLTDITIICKNGHKFSQTPFTHLRGHGCAECNGTALLSQEKFIEKVKDIHKNIYDY